VKNEIEINDELIAKYLAGEASPEEAVALDDWLQVSENRGHFRALQKMWEASFPSKAHRPVHLENAWAKVEQRKHAGRETSHTRNLAKSNAIFKIAASVLLILSFGGILYLYHAKKPQDISLSSRDSLKHIHFEDKSMAILNRNSQLVYPQNFDNKQREVEVRKGEAFFNVTPDAAKPFIVRTEIATIKVLGTAFNVLVKADTLEVSVDHGKVLVYTLTDSVYLEKGEAAFLSGNDTAIKTQDSNSNEWAYATHKFVFNNASINEVFRYVEKAQDCTINIANPEIGNCKLTATFESVSTDYMLNLITEALNLSVTKNDDRTFTVEGEGCH
jgi:ferric-dicitrate binding protein FerR (iron transport regulator)